MRKPNLINNFTYSRLKRLVGVSFGSYKRQARNVSNSQLRLTFFKEALSVLARVQTPKPDSTSASVTWKRATAHRHHRFSDCGAVGGGLVEHLLVWSIYRSGAHRKAFVKLISYLRAGRGKISFVYSRRHERIVC